MISANEVKVLDINSEYFGIPTIKLMENAGRGVSDFIFKNLKFKDKKIIIFCGSGNNGGDGFVAARYLAKKNEVCVFLIGDNIKTDISSKNFNKLKQCKIKIFSNINEVDFLLKSNDIIIDSMLGIGIIGDIREPYLSIVKKINSISDKMIISVDIPTGFGSKIAIKPDYTITFHDKKENMSKDNCGEIFIVDIGIPKDAVDFVGPGELSVYYPRPKKHSHKGENGSVLIIGGGPYSGAPALSGLAALRTGADLVYIATPMRCWQVVASFSPNLIVKGLNSDFLNSDDVSSIKNLIVKCDCVVIGPGLGDLKDTEKAILEIIQFAVSENKSLVIDADAIKPLRDNYDILMKSNTIITPHAGEFEDLTGEKFSNDLDVKIEIVKFWSEKLGVTLFLKGPIDILSDGEKIKLNKVHNEAMTVGGTGDVLAGIIGALLSKKVNLFNAVRTAAFINGEAGNLAFDKKSYGLLATDIIEEIPNVLIKYL